jgi:hypothetical protein
MKITLSVVAFVSLVLASAGLGQRATPGPATADAFKSLAAAMKNEIQSAAKANGEGDEKHREGFGMAQSLAAEMASAMERNDFTNAEHMFGQISVSFTSEEVLKQLESTRAAIKKDRETRQNAYVADVNAALNDAAKAVNTATNPEDFDQPLKNLSRFRNNYGSEMQSEEMRIAQNKAQAALHFLEQWQNYIAARKNGNTEQARNSLQNLTGNEYFDLMPRSRILVELQKYSTGQGKPNDITAEEVDKIASKAKKLDDVSAIIKELRELRSRSHNMGGSDSLNPTLNALVAIDNNYHDFQAGLPTKIDIYGPGGMEALSRGVPALKAQLLFLVLPRYLNAPNEASKPGETLQTFLERIGQEARQRGDGALVIRVRNVQRQLMGGSFGDNETNAISLAMAGQNQEAAGQFMLAVVSYQNALKTGSDAVPAKMIGERLAAIKSAHPQEYEQGMDFFMSPPRYDRPGFPPQIPPGRRPPGQPDYDRAEKNLAIPAASPTRAASATPSPSPTSTPKK